MLFQTPMTDFLLWNRFCKRFVVVLDSSDVHNSIQKKYNFVHKSFVHVNDDNIFIPFTNYLELKKHFLLSRLKTDPNILNGYCFWSKCILFANVHIFTEKQG